MFRLNNHFAILEAKIDNYYVILGVFKYNDRLEKDKDMFPRIHVTIRGTQSQMSISKQAINILESNKLREIITHIYTI